MQNGFGTFLVVEGVTHDRAKHRGVAPITTTDIDQLPDVTGEWAIAWNSATLYVGVRGYGYPADARDARSFGDTIVPVEDGDLIHGAWLHAANVGPASPVPPSATFLSLEPSTTYVAQLVVGELRKNVLGGTRVVTNDVVSGTANEFGKKPKPVLAQVCFQTAASPS